MSSILEHIKRPVRMFEGGVCVTIPSVVYYVNQSESTKSLLGRVGSVLLEAAEDTNSTHSRVP